MEKKSNYLPLVGNPGENRYLTSKVKAAVMPLLVYCVLKKLNHDTI
jgi:hypothetical protein